MGRDVDTHAILNPRAGAGAFTLDRRAPSADLAPFVERYWIVRWDLRDKPPFAQETLPLPCVNLVFGTHRPGLHGIPDERFVAHLDGVGWVVGVKFRPGGFRPFWHDDVATLTARALAIAEAIDTMIAMAPIGSMTRGGDDGAAIDRAVHDASDDDARIARIEAFLRGRTPIADEQVEQAARAVAIAQADPSLARVDDLADRAGVPVRTLERLFRAYVGVPPKWVLRRFRVQEAAARIAQGTALDGSALAHELGYTDQSHLIRDFKAQVGRTPADYAAHCAQTR
jgi:AraC-like DNA-binding protein